MQRRRVHVRTAIADSRIEGGTISAAELEVFEAYIRGEIEAGDLVTASLKRHKPARSEVAWRCAPGSNRLVAVLQTAAFPFRQHTAPALDLDLVPSGCQVMSARASNRAG